MELITYEADAVLTYLENAAVDRLNVSASGCTLLDVDCGTGRRLRGAGADVAVGVDLTSELLAKGRGELHFAAGDVRALPFSALTFDIVWCRLMLGQVREMEAAYGELSRVCCMGGLVVVSDMSAEMVTAGHTRTFRDAERTMHALAHFAHSIERQAVAAYDVGLRLERRQDGIVDPTVRPLYVDAGREAAYEAQLGMTMVRALLWRKNAA
ncbi:MAG: class I SAM-dependent methyltransferase [Gemmatimonadaceae bacterium]